VKILEDERNLWDRQPGESSEAFEAWILYRDMGPERKQVRVARGLSKSDQLISKWSANNQWKRRVEAWEIYLDQRRQEEIVLEVIEARKRQLQIGKTLQSKGLAALLALEPVRSIKNAQGVVEHTLRIKVSELLRLLEVGAQHVQGALGEVDEDKPTKFELIFEERHDGEEPPPRVN
jgi:hypothetical protein